MSSAVNFEMRGKVAVVTLNRPERGNATNAEVADGMVAAWARVNGDPAISVAILTGAGDRHFCTGADVSALANQAQSQAANVGVPEGWKRASRMMPHTAGVKKPVLVAVNGVAAGAGIHYVLEGDVVIASDHAAFLDPHVTVGQVAGFEPPLLARRIPFEAAMRMVLMGSFERISAERALQLGLVSEVVPHDQLLPRALELAELIARNSPAALIATKQAAWNALELPLSEAFRRGWDLVTAHYASPDQTEGPAAFSEKRQPNWQAI